jgi:hypothetical protein
MNGNHDWYRVLKNPKISEIIIANIKGYDDEDCENGCDKTEEALDLLEVVPAGKKVYVGLVYEKDFNVKKIGDAARDQDCAMAKAFWKAAKKRNLHGRINGWYLGREWHNFAPKEADATDKANLKKYLRELSAELRGEFPSHVIAVAPFFRPHSKKICPEYPDAPTTATRFRELLDGTDVNLLLLQDGFGVRHKYACMSKLSLADYASAAEMYATEVAAAMNLLKIRFAVDLEAFGPLEKDQCRLPVQFQSIPSQTPVFVYSQRDCLATGICQ